MTTHELTNSVELVPTTDDDAGFVDDLLLADAQALFVDLPAGQREDLARMQVRARNQSYAEAYPDARHFVITVDDVPVGRLVLAETGAVVHVVDIRLAARWRNQGVGSTVVTRVCADASGTGRAVELSVDPQSPAVRLYERLGFHRQPSDGHPLFLRCRREVPQPT
jgi:GNAT superfamily N-acetyltransferase